MNSGGGQMNVLEKAGGKVSLQESNEYLRY